MPRAHRHGSSAVSASKRRLGIVFLLSAVYLIVEVFGGVMTRSLALLADAGHMLTDVAGLGLALFAIRFAERPANPERTYGYYRVEILAALANAIVLIGISVYVLIEAYKRFRDPPEVDSGVMMAIAAVGLVVNIVGVVLLKAGSSQSLNVRGAYFEVFSDMLTSIGVLLAGAIIWFTGWRYADPLISALIGLLILPRTWLLLREALGILLEGTPSDVNVTALRQSLCSVEGVQDVHDLHVWTLTSGMNAMSVHVVVRDPSRQDDVLGAVHDAATRNFEIGHVTVQIEAAGWRECEMHL